MPNNEQQCSFSLLKQTNVHNSYNIKKLMPINVNQICQPSHTEIYFLGLWYKSESLFRDWTFLYKSVYVMSGSIFDADNDGFRDKDNQTKRQVLLNYSTLCTVREIPRMQVVVSEK